MAFIYPAEPDDAIKIALRLGLHRAGRGWRGTCPNCMYVNALALNQRAGKPLIWCVNCQDREAMAGILRDAGALSARAAEPTPERLPCHRPDRESRVARAAALWAGGEALTPDCPAGRYLGRRSLAGLISSPALRWRRDVPHPSGGRRIALLAAITGPDGALQGLHRIFLDRDGRKADVEPQKASLGNVTGGAIRLQSCSAELAVAEGLESAASAGLLLNLPAWSAISAGNMARGMILPAEVRSVVIAADADEPGEEAAKQAAWRWQAEGRTVKIARPFRSGADFNDLAREAV